MADIRDPNFLHNSIQKVLKYTGRIYSTRSLQIRGVFAVQVHVRRVRGANSHIHLIMFKKFQFCGFQVAAQELDLSEFPYWRDIAKAFHYLHLVRVAHALVQRKHPGFEEISSSRCIQYILKLSGSYYEES